MNLPPALGRELKRTPHYCPVLKCFATGAYLVIPDRRTVVIDLGESSCTDMRGAIKRATELLPTVQRIFTVAGHEQDTTYQRESCGEWLAFDPAPINGVTTP